MRPYRSYFYAVIPVLAVFFISCGNGVDDVNSNGDTTRTSDSTTASQRINTQNVFYNIPSPVETSTLLLEAGAEYDPSVVNDPTKYKTYTTEEARAINIGVYGADLSFCGVFENSVESMVYLKAVNSLCKDLGISGVFDEKTADRLEKNKDNRDSILDIVSKSFWEADAYLKDNQRPNTSSLLVAGGWVEGMYIACKVYETTKKQKIRDRVVCAPQKSSLKSLVSLLESSKQSASSQYILDGLKDLKKTYDKIPDGKPTTRAVTDTATGETTIETVNTVVVSDEMFAEVMKGISDLRAKMISGK